MTQEEAFKALAARLDHARREHPFFAQDTGHAVDVVFDEYQELKMAWLHDEGPSRVIDEALDVAATAMRLVIGEVQG